MRFSGTLLVVALSFLLTLQPLSSSPLGTPVQRFSPAYVPDTQWESTAAEAQGMSSAVLEGLVQYINESGTPMHGLVISRNGYIVTE